MLAGCAGVSAQAPDTSIAVDFTPYPSLYALIACDGEGGLGIAVNQDATELDPFFHDAIMVHENYHVTMIDMFWPGRCEGKPRGFVVPPESPTAAYYGECLAYFVESRFVFMSGLPSAAAARWQQAQGVYGCTDAIAGEARRIDRALEHVAKNGGQAHIEIVDTSPPRIWITGGDQPGEI